MSTLHRRFIFLIVSVFTLAACGEKGVTPDLDVFDDVSRRVLDRAREAVERADGFEQSAVLAGIPPGSYDVRSIRFNELTEQVEHSRSIEPGKSDLAESRTIQRWTFAPDQDRPAELERQLMLDVKPISSALIGAIALRAVAPTDAPVRLQIVVAGGLGAGGVEVRLDLISDGAVHDYTVDLRAILDGRGDGLIKRIIIDWEAGSAACIESVEVLTRTWEYSAPWGVGSGRVSGETRPVVYLTGQGSLSWELEGSWHDARLSFSLAEVVRDQKTRVRVELSKGGQHRQLAEAELVGGEDWTEEEIAIGAVDLDGARLTISVDGAGNPEESGGVVLWGAPVLWEPPTERLNVLVLLEDALRADRMSMYGHDRDTTPYKTRLFADGVRFERCIASATATRFSCPSLMTSLRPLATGVYGFWNQNPRLAEGYVTLAEVFASRGWATASFLQNGNAGPENGLEQGFELVVENIPGRADAVYGGPALDWIEGVGDRNFFGYLHIIDPHGPYEPPEPNRNWYETILADGGGPRWEDPAWLTNARRALYDGEVASNDEALPALIEKLEEMGILDTTLLVLVADHGEFLGEHDSWGHAPPSYIQGIHVPMLMRCPGRLAAEKVVFQPIQNLDLMPTILTLADIDISRFPLHGRSLVPLITDEAGALPLEIAVVQEAMLFSRFDDPHVSGSLVWDRWHYLRSIKATPMLFDLSTDRAEERPILPSREFDVRAEAVLSELRQFDETLRRSLGGDSSQAVRVRLDTIHNLEALGYLDN